MSFNVLRLLLVEDDELFRLGLQVKLQQEAGLEIVAEAEDGEVGIAVQWEVIEVVLPEELASEIQEEPNEVDV